MSEQEQIIYMQARILEMTMERFHLTREEAVSMFRTYNLATLIEENFDLYHMEGDESVFYDLTKYLGTKGVTLHD